MYKYYVLPDGTVHFVNPMTKQSKENPYRAFLVSLRDEDTGGVPVRVIFYELKQQEKV